MVYFFYFALAAVVVFLAVKLADYVDMLDKTTKISGAFIGGVLLAAVTSLPELITSISATLLIRQNEMVLGNILGSNLFNFAVMGLSLMIFVRSVHTAKLTKNHLMSLGAMLVMYGLIALDMFLEVFPKIGWFSLASPLILLSYIAFLLLTPKTEAPSSDASAPLSLKQIIFRFAIAAVLLVAASVAITYVSDIVADKLSLGKTFAGALLLGVATSLPEMASTLSLCKKSNYNAAFGNILGSNVFNCFIFVISDFLSFGEGQTDVYVQNFSSSLLIILGAAAAVLFVYLVSVLLSQKERKLLKRISSASVGGLAAAAYLVFVALSAAV